MIIRGVFIAAASLPEAQPDRHLVTALAHQLRNSNLVASHETAALVHGLPLLNPESAARAQPRFTRNVTPQARSTVKPQVLVRRLPADAVTDVNEAAYAGLRLTSQARTAIDLAAEFALPEALMVTDFVTRQNLAAFRGGYRTLGTAELPHAAKMAALQPLLQAPVCRAHNSPAVTQVIAHTNPLRESPAESLSFGHIVDAGLPAPRCQAHIETDAGVMRVDFYWEEFDLIGECDGRIKYDGTVGEADESLVHQSAREQALRDAGHGMVRWAAAGMAFRTHAVLDAITQRLRARGWPG